MRDVFLRGREFFGNERTNMKRFFLIFLLALLFWAFSSSVVLRQLSFEEIKQNQAYLNAMVTTNPTRYGVFYFLLYVFCTALGFPVAAVLTLAGGAVFGFLKGLLMASFASTIGATLSFLASRFFFRGWILHRWEKKAQHLDQMFSKNPIGVLFFLRLVPLFPYFLINLLAGVTSISLFHFYWVSQLGMLPVTALYVNAGTELSMIQTPAEILSPRVLAAFTLAGMAPILAGKLMRYWKRRTGDA